MKTILTVILFVISLNAFSQPPGVKISAPVTVCDSIILNVGDMIELGTGTNDNGDFKFVYQPMHISGVAQHPLSSVHSGLSYPIKSFREIKNKYSRKVIATIMIGSFAKVVEIESAIKSGEVVVK